MKTFESKLKNLIKSEIKDASTELVSFFDAEDSFKTGKKEKRLRISAICEKSADVPAWSLESELKTIKAGKFSQVSRALKARKACETKESDVIKCDKLGSYDVELEKYVQFSGCIHSLKIMKPDLMSGLRQRLATTIVRCTNTRRINKIKNYVHVKVCVRYGINISNASDLGESVKGSILTKVKLGSLWDLRIRSNFWDQPRLSTREGSLKGVSNKDLLTLAGDIHKNPGPDDRPEGNDRDGGNAANGGERGDGGNGRPTGRWSEGNQISVKALTYNVRGLNDPNKVRHLINQLNKDYLSKDHDSIIALQETNILKPGLIPYIWRGNYLLTAGSGSGRGCITLLSSHLNIVEHKDFDERGHVFVRQRSDSQLANYVIANVYGPNQHNQEKIDFFERVLDAVKCYLRKRLELTGH